MIAGAVSFLRTRRADVVIAVGLLAAEVLGTGLWSGGMNVGSPSPVGYALLVAIAVAVAVRNVWPVGALVGISGAAAAYVWLMEPGPTWIFGIVFGIWAAVAAGRRYEAIAITAALVASVLLAVATGRAGHIAEPDAPYWLVGWLVASFVLGEVSRGRREYLEQVEQRALDAERTREEEARRRAGEERLRIARELHDVLAHHIAVINVQAGVAVHLIDRNPEQARSALVAISSASKEAMRELRATLGVLRQVDDVEPRQPTPGLDRLDDLLASARATGLEVSMTTSGVPESLPPSIDVAAYRIVQESLTNATRHSGAAHVAVGVSYGPDAVEVTVEDDGRGAAAGTVTPGNGLTGMRERAAALGGLLEAGPRADGGFRVRALLPVAPAR